MFVSGKLTKDKAENICKWYFRAGFVGLPWLWAANVMMFSLYRGESIPIAWYCRWSTIFFAASVVIFFVWYAILYTQFPDASFWVIYPNGNGKQQGYFSAAVYGAP